MDITAAELNQRLFAGEALPILDVRGELEYHTYNIGGINIPLPKLPGSIEDMEWDLADEIIVVCTMGLRSKTGKTILDQSGYTNVRNLKGGLVELQKLNKDQ
ncbi:rhodanese-like domain-containing protein [Mucilaginibacter sp. HMF5004]|uniref:rhodanese-like domain-containing protein n=1 Tax=Mucilaginibacter rivuli TaxID=2857527 RepID=UPI001C5EC7A2|nr:rhodanese-like domain-containing protein [Mucilaginibacter rivuli]MBW4891863.1 rhodanese-like domain-containing protein [Mucilaginibacter rivuli]